MVQIRYTAAGVGTILARWAFPVRLVVKAALYGCCFGSCIGCNLRANPSAIVDGLATDCGADEPASLTTVWS